MLIQEGSLQWQSCSLPAVVVVKLLLTWQQFLIDNLDFEICSKSCSICSR